MDYRVTDKDIEKTGIDWIIHYVNDTHSFKRFMCDCHTHGIDKYLGKELQIVLNTKPSLNTYIINYVGKLIVNGKKFVDGDKVFGLFLNQFMPIGFKDAKDFEGKDILRIYLPDENYNLFENAEGIYAKQHENPYKKE